MSELIVGNKDASGNAKAPKIEFPCRYPIKILGKASAGFKNQVVTAVRVYAPDFSEADVSIRASSKGRFSAVTIYITATGQKQLQAIFDVLKKIDNVKMVL